MKYPTPGEYQQAVQFPAAAFTDPLLQEAESETNALGLPRAITGAFAVVFPVTMREARWAVKCFLIDVHDQQRRYRAISEHLADRPLPYMADFEYQRKGIQVEGRTYPILKMEWLDGMSLNRFVASHLNDLRPLIPAWRAMIADLEAAQIAHGDLQHGNVLVDQEQLWLVDYDTMYVPALEGKRSVEVGHRNYQHPDRDERDFGPYLDRFSALVIDTALQACAARPELWERFESGENLLFRSDDFADPGSSALFDELRRIDHLRPRVEALERACFIEPKRVPSLREVVADAQAVPAASKKGRRRASADDARPSRNRFEELLLPVAVAAAGVIALVVVVLGWLAGAAVGVLFLAIASVAIVLQHRRLPVVRRHRRLLREDAYFQRLIGGLRDELATMHRQRAEFQQSREGRAAERLEEIQEERMDEHLKHHFVGEARGFEGLTHKVVVRLKAAGIRTASHATPERVGEIARLSPESKARVNLWRSTLAGQYQDDIPASLSPAEARRLKRGLERQLSEFDRNISRMEEKIVVQQREHEKIRERLEVLNVPSLRHYAAFLLRLPSPVRRAADLSGPKSAPF